MTLLLEKRVKHLKQYTIPTPPEKGEESETAPKSLRVSSRKTLRHNPLTKNNEDQGNCITISKDCVTVIQDGACAFYSLKLLKAPSKDIIVTINDPSGILVTIPKTVIFLAEATPGQDQHWDTAQSVRIQASRKTQADSNVDGLMLQHTFNQSKVPAKILAVRYLTKESRHIYQFGDFNASVNYVPKLQPFDFHWEEEAEKLSFQKKRKSKQHDISFEHYRMR